ncbi:MAG: glycoside hydrolase N-terminal domain-containing protein [Methylacidiphilales bacterium]|nr:glycoside hydrolase N-terminal domain-containing protein [Candidatus Methylacidiphilales bacterium]
MFDPFEQAALHPILHDGPAVNFFSGALLGNGGMGAVVCTRPDAIVIHFGHNSVWDIRIAEATLEKLGTFAQVFARVRAINPALSKLGDDPWFREYCHMASASYRKPYPRPFPCGSLVLGFDSRETETLGHRLDLATGVCTVELLWRGERRFARIFVEHEADRLRVGVFDATGAPASSPFLRVRLLPSHPSAGGLGQPAPGPGPTDDMPPYSECMDEAQRSFCFRQILPAAEPEVYDPKTGHPDDRAIRLNVTVNSRLTSRNRMNWFGNYQGPDALERDLTDTDLFFACVQLDHGPATGVPNGAEVLDITHATTAAAAERIAAEWRAYWRRSGVALADAELEAIWYRNLYFLACSLRPGVTCPGDFANWSYGNIGSAWHGDYHLNYNTQQAFWATFSSNHVELHLPYVDLVDHMLPVSRAWARDYYQLGGACFPHSAYPVKMSIPPYPVPTWGWEICETPWAVQSLWWHYLYTMDAGFLRDRAIGPIREAVLFLCDYLSRPDAHGPQWNDDHFHVFPTVVPEIYELTPGLEKNADCIVDLTLIRFVFRAYIKACGVLGIGAPEQELLARVGKLLPRLPDYPTAKSASGTVFVNVRGEDPEIVQNTPNTLMTVFPGEDHGLHSPPDMLAICRNSLRRHRNEGGNDLVFLNLQAARLGCLDLERFKRHVRYCLLPNGTCTDMCRQMGGRYRDDGDFDFMARMGIWFENFSLPAVINECLMQSYSGVLRLFPNWPKERDAEFRTLRAAGAFLVSAGCGGGTVTWVEVLSETGGDLVLLNPWPGKVRCQRGEETWDAAGEQISIATNVGDLIRLTKAP